MYEIIKDGYPYIDVNKRVNNLDWLANKEKYLKRIKSAKNDREFINELSSILKDLNNGHTQLIDNKNSYMFMKKIYGKTGFYNFLNDKKVAKRYKNLKSESVKEQSTSSYNLILGDVIKDKIGYIYLPRMMPEGKSINDDLMLISQYIKTLDNHKALIIDIRGNGGGSDYYWEGIVSRLINEDKRKYGFALFRDNNEVINYYVSSPKLPLQPISNLPYNIMKNAPKEVPEKFNKFLEINRVIKSNSVSKFKGKIYLLVDSKVFSASESFAIFCKDNNFATLIGTKTGGDGGGGDPVLFALPNSRLIVRMSSNMFLTKTGKCNEEFKTTPDILVEDCERFNDVYYDNCIKKVLQLEGIKINEDIQ